MSDNKRKKVALGGALFFHLIIISICFVIKFSYAAEKERKDFSDVIFFNPISSIEIMDNKKTPKKVEEKKQQPDQEESVDVLNVEPQLEDRVNKLFDNLLNPSDNNENEELAPIEGCLDPEAINYKLSANIDDNSCIYSIQGGNLPEEIDGRKKIRGGDLQYGNCEVVTLHVNYKLKVTVKKDGHVEVINCIDMSGVGNSCLKDAAESAANSILFEKGQDTYDVDKIGDTFYLLYTFAPKTEED